MKKYIALLSVLIFFTASAGEEKVSYSLADQLADLSNIGTGIKAIDLINNPSNESSCQTIRSQVKSEAGDGMIYKTCAVTAEDYKNKAVMVMKYDNYHQVPEELRKELPAITNESDWSRPYYVFAMMDEIGVTLAGGINFGDDRGFTYGSKIGTGATYRNKIDVEATITGNLYTYEIPGSRKREEDGVITADQLYRNETIFKIMANNQREGRLYYWKADAGLVHVSPKENYGLIDGSNQQRNFHQLLNNFKIGDNPNFKYINDQQGDFFGMFVGGLLGLQKSIQMGSNCIVTGRIGVGGRISNLPEHIYAQALAGGDVSYQIGSGKVVASVEASQYRHLGGNLLDITTGVAYQGKRHEVGVYVTRHSGQLMNGAVLYNLPNVENGMNDSTWELRYKYYLK